MADDTDLIALTVDVVANFVTHNAIEPGELPAFIASTHAAIAAIAAGDPPVSQPATLREPAVSVRKSLASREHILSLIDGKPYRSLKRHLRAHGLTPQQYREQFGLRPDYPMVAPAYSEARRAIAERFGLGHGRGAAERTRATTPEREAGPANAAGQAASRARRKLSIVT